MQGSGLLLGKHKTGLLCSQVQCSIRCTFLQCQTFEQSCTVAACIVKQKAIGASAFLPPAMLFIFATGIVRQNWDQHTRTSAD